jgi:hypothetical protein
MREHGLAAYFRSFVKLVEGERDQRQRAWGSGGILREYRVEPEPRLRIYPRLAAKPGPFRLACPYIIIGRAVCQDRELGARKVPYLCRWLIRTVRQPKERRPAGGP